MGNETLIIRPKLKGEDGYKVFSVRIKNELVVRMDDIAARTGRSRNELIGTFLEYALDRCVIEEEEEKPTWQGG
ncbi:MAG: CopG family transcriptional regulator [Lawsonibacter sp.]|nr:CopG family transcriptional regulator [Lawsonibacter sp.]